MRLDLGAIFPVRTKKNGLGGHCFASSQERAFGGRACAHHGGIVSIQILQQWSPQGSTSNHSPADFQMQLFPLVVGRQFHAVLLPKPNGRMHEKPPRTAEATRRILNIVCL